MKYKHWCLMCSFIKWSLLTISVSWIVAIVVLLTIGLDKLFT